ncbi:transcription-repair coupling factor [[Clostridium] ultunense Esp]|uniref:transcription-repair coupling factor n=1 Tax=Thermicanus aegyptius TaxID=94009 RepID=UPI0002B70B31|nr:transcription-repair coupling factor [Thermicanus aegyptius]CCQ98194.1 transcription-repair coupling factor [[Clostridium] ultunense Esp]
MLRSFTELLRMNAEFQTLWDGMKRGMKEQLVTGLSGSSRQVFAGALVTLLDRKAVFITHNNYQAQKVYEDLAELLGEEQVLFFPAEEIHLIDYRAASPEIRSARIRALNLLCSENSIKLVVTPYLGLTSFLTPPAIWKEGLLTVRRGDQLPLETVIKSLLLFGYERVEEIENRGQFAQRGGIVDLFPLDAAEPIRIEWFDEEVDSIRYFRLEDQRSTRMATEVRISPAYETYLPENKYRETYLRVEEKLNAELEKLHDKERKEALSSRVLEDLSHFREGSYFKGIERYLALIYDKPATLLDYLGEDAFLLFDEPSRITEVAEQYEHEEAEWVTGEIEKGRLIPGVPLSYSYEEAMGGARQKIYLSLFIRQVKKGKPQNIVSFLSRSMQEFHGQLHLLKSELSRWLKQGYPILFLAADEERAERLARVLKDYKMEVDLYRELPFPLPVRPMIYISSLQSGFEWITLKIAVVTEKEVFHQRAAKKRKGEKMEDAERIRSYLDLKVGDYVVHVNHGIGRFMGVETLTIDGIHKDYLHIKYAGNDKLFVPVEQLDLIQKYLASDEHEPKIYSLGGNEWKRVKNKVKSSVKDIAEDLLKLYAKREAAKGYAFSPDTPYQREFEAMFPYQETEDQLKAIQEIKRDMEKPRPMDRLLCGDVGYGKTEVAIRAAFKAVLDGKQVAVLVPTTILAQQHYETFKERFADFAVKIGVLSRFRTRSEQNEIIKELRNGTLDIVIGTHRLLSKDVTFKDLGLLIVDEEQRFGVTHKERIKQLKENVDVLTLTATPIPRTLHMSLIGVRDLSLIETPPENRFPVQTYVLEYSPSVVKEAIERELARDGQVFFLYNYVQGIYKMAEQISALVPDARVAVAHGQMPEHELETVMLDFLDRNYDVLVSTSIIETGVDIPNVNTLIIYDADHMGLSQLYQLRGRVGRSNRIAYAYFTYQKGKVLNEAAEKRLEAIKEFTELGSGFKIAMRDLAIRGAGNLLGAEQHGFINSVGFDLYNQMLKEAISELKGEVVEEHFEPEIVLPLDAYLPEAYIGNVNQKIAVYKRFSGVRTLKEWEDLRDELIDRFGDPPAPVERLLLLTKVKTYAYSFRIKRIYYENGQIKVEFNPEGFLPDVKLLYQVTTGFKERIGFSSGQGIGITVKVKESAIEEGLRIVEQILTKLAEAEDLKGVSSHA